MKSTLRRLYVGSLAAVALATGLPALSGETKFDSKKCDAVRQQDGTTFTLIAQAASPVTLRWKRTEQNLRDRFILVEVTFDRVPPDGQLVTRSPFRFFAPDSYPEQTPTAVVEKSEATIESVSLDITSFESRIIPCSAWRTFIASATR